MKERATATQRTTNEVVADSTVALEPSVAAALQDFNLLKRTVQRKRQIVNHAPANPHNIQELDIPEQYSKTLAYHEFHLYDSRRHDNEVVNEDDEESGGHGIYLIFATRANLQRLSQSQHWFADGTFKSCPKLFNQLYTIHCVQHQTVLPCVFILMTNRREATYHRVFETLEYLQQNLNPVSILSDFERAAINAFITSSPNSDHRGCFFHLTQNIWRRIQDNCEIKNRYIEEPEFATIIKKLACLSFVPVADVTTAYDALMTTKFFYENEILLRPLLDYFEDNYVGRLPGTLRRMNRLPPSIAIDLWNQYDSVLQDVPKTNNNIEGWHRRFSSLLGGQHPTIWKFVDALKKEESLTEFQFNQYAAGTLPRINKDSHAVAKRIKNQVIQYNRQNVLDYLNTLSKNINLNV
jgi:hypothetical protein